MPDVEKFTNKIYEVVVDHLIKEPKKIQLLIKQVLEKNRNETREPFGIKMARGGG